MRWERFRRPWRIAGAVAALCLAGCAPAVRWGERVGVYTYDDATREWGPPAVRRSTPEGGTVAEWWVSDGRGADPPSPEAWRVRSESGFSARPQASKVAFRLTFNAQNKLMTFQKLN